MEKRTIYELNRENIDRASAEITEFLESMKVDRKTVLRIRIGTEETLLRYMDELGEGRKFTLSTGKMMGRTRVAVSVPGRMYDPFIKDDTPEDSSAFMRAALANMGELPVWRYSRGINTIVYSIRETRIQEWKQLILAIALAVVSALILKVIPQNITEFIHNGLLLPLINTFMNFLSGIAGPMIFLAIVWGIYSIGDVSAFSVMGKKLFVRFMSYTFLLTVAAGLLMLPVFSLSRGSMAAGDGFTEVFRMLLDIVPGNIILPFTNGNTLQILFIGTVMGIAMIMIGEKTQTVAIFAEQLNYIVQIIMEFISKLVPFFVFGSLLDIILSNQFDDIRIASKLFAVNAAGIALFMVFYIVLVGIRMKMSPLKYLKKDLKSFIICLMTASSAAAFSTSLETCRDGFGMDERLTDFGVPFAQIIFKPTVAILYLSSAFYAAEMFGTSVSPAWFASALIMSVILSVATPPIPGGAVASISVLFAQLGIPPEGIAIVLALNIILDFLETPADVFGGHAQLVLAADRFSLIDKEKLRK